MSDQEQYPMIDDTCPHCGTNICAGWDADCGDYLKCGITGKFFKNVDGVFVAKQERGDE